MESQKRRKSFRLVLSISMLICWILPIIIISTTASMLLNRNYNRNLRRAAESELRNAMWQVEVRLNSVIEDSKAVSYDGVVRQAYQDHRRSPTESQLYRTVTDYLNGKFSRDMNYRAVFVSFLDESLDILPYYTAPGESNVELLRFFHGQVLPAARELTADRDAGIVFMVLDGRLYMVRSLLDSDFVPYATLVTELAKEELLQALYSIARNETLDIRLDGISIPLDIETEVTMEPSRIADISYSSEVEGHELVCAGQVIGLNIWTTVPMLRWIVLFVLSLVGPMLAIIIWLFYRNINHPIEILMNATSRIQNGERGFQIQKKAPNSEFSLLYHDFNAMSRDLKSQFDRLYEEQQALQLAKIKALQSQINPHFLNNTLEVINWEARLAANDRVCDMIEALSTMLDAAIGRDGRSQVLLEEELKYVEAYLHITQERLGDRLTVRTDVDPAALECTVPLLMLQPILENAVEYDLSRSGGELSMTIRKVNCRLHLEVIHDGCISTEGWKKIKAGLNPDPAAAIDGRSVGIRNVVNRLALLYGDSAKFDIRVYVPGKILAEIDIPACGATSEVKI